MEDFNPDVYIANKTASDPNGGFNPDTYIQEKMQPDSKDPTDPKSLEFERGPNYPTAAMTDATPGDLMAVQGAAGLAKAATGMVGTEGLNALSQYAKRFGQNQALKATGAAGGQIGQVGIPESREIAQMLIDKGVVSPFRGPIGLEEKVSELSKAAGQGIGDMRKSGDAMGGAPQMSDILSAVKGNLEGKYASGVNKGMGGLNRAREEIAKGGTGTFTGNAQKATELNQAASAGKIYRPQDATTDVADTISHMNNEALKKTLAPAEYAKYESQLKDYGQLNKVHQFLERGERREMGGHMGAGTVTKALADKTMDAFGNRAAASIGSKLGDALNVGTRGDIAANAAIPASKSLAAYLMDEKEDK